MMPNTNAPIRWARRVEQHKIRRLYASDARGIVDEELIAEVRKERDRWRDDVGESVLDRARPEPK